jgi:hypothetical protein
LPTDGRSSLLIVLIASIFIKTVLDFALVVPVESSKPPKSAKKERKDKKEGEPAAPGEAMSKEQVYRIQRICLRHTPALLPFCESMNDAHQL